jgi:hypothetical protein
MKFWYIVVPESLKNNFCDVTFKAPIIPHPHLLLQIVFPSTFERGGYSLFTYAELIRPCSYSKLTSKAFPLHSKKAQKQVMAFLYPHLAPALHRGGCSTSSPDRCTPGNRPGTHVQMGGPQAQSGLVPKIWPPPWFEPRTVKPVASRYTKTWMVHMFIALLHFWHATMLLLLLLSSSSSSKSSLLCCRRRCCCSCSCSCWRANCQKLGSHLLSFSVGVSHLQDTNSYSPLSFTTETSNTQ